MSFMSHDERVEILQNIDVFYMIKAMHEENIDPGFSNHHDIGSSEAFKMCLLSIQEVYPYFKIRPSWSEDKEFILTVSLPYKLKSYYKTYKKNIDHMISWVDFYFGELNTKWHYNEVHVESFGTIQYHDLLKAFMKEMKAIREKEELL